MLAPPQVAAKLPRARDSLLVVLLGTKPQREFAFALSGVEINALQRRLAEPEGDPREQPPVVLEPCEERRRLRV